MKNRILIIITICYFLVINTSYLWEMPLGDYNLPIFILLSFTFLILTVTLVFQLLKIIKEKFKNKKNNYTVLILAVTLTLVLIFPEGIVNFNSAKDNHLLVAQREGAANCLTSFYLNENNEFKEIVSCFGLTETKGDYTIQNDTIFFSNVTSNQRVPSKYYEFAVIKLNEQTNKNELFRFSNKKDSIGNELWIIENNL